MIRKLWWVGSAALLLLAGGALLVGHRGDGGEGGAEGDVAGRAAAYGAQIGLRLPAEARAEFADWMAGPDNAARIAFVVPDAGWAAFRAGLPPGPFDAMGRQYFPSDQAGWAPGRAPGLTSAGFPWRGGAEALNVGVAPAGPGEHRVFLFWHQL